jgi:adenylate cyclase
MSAAPDPDPTTGDAVQAVSDWIIDQGLAATRLDRFVAGLADRLVGRLGLPLWRFHLSLATLHPSYEAEGVTWRRDTGVRAESYPHGLQGQADWQESPLKVLVDGRLPGLRQRLDNPAAPHKFPILRQFAAEGATDWLARLVGFGGPDQPTGLPGTTFSFTTDRVGGFSDREVAAMERLSPRIGLAVYRMALQDIATTLLDAYVGPDAGRRILSGQVERGAATPITAVVLLADLRGFTALADRMDGDALLVWLNAVLSRVVETVAEAGGEVLKFLGDGLLAMFPIEGGDAAGATRRALTAARSAQAAHAALAEAEPAAPALPLDIALDLGPLLYGNVGGVRRLDFTVIGPAVNEAARLEPLCAGLGEPILVSERFAEAYPGALRDLGRQNLKGLDRPRRLLAPPAA